MWSSETTTSGKFDLERDVPLRPSASFYRQSKIKLTPFALAARSNANQTSVPLYDIFRHIKTNAKTFGIFMRRGSRPIKLTEHLSHIALRYAYTVISD